MSDLNTPSLEHFCNLKVLLGKPIELGEGSSGKRRIIPIVGGSVSGPMLEGSVINLGADWQTIYQNNTAHLDTRYAVQTKDGAVIEIINRGLRHGPNNVMKDLSEGKPVPADKYYMRTHATLETGDERYKWVNDFLFLGTGARNKNSVDMRLFLIR